jgi:tetratricopeptide (TPR) repeat protein
MDNPLPSKQAKISREDIQAAMKANNEAVHRKKNGKNEDAIPLYHQAISLYPQYAIAYYNLSLLYQEQNNLAEALANSNKAIELNPRDPEFYNNRGNIFAKKQAIEKAIADYNYAIHLSPNYSEPYHNRAYLYAVCKEWDSCLSDLKRAVELNPNLVGDYFNIACAYAKKGDTENAFTFLEKSFFNGYKNWSKVKTDPDLEGLRSNPAWNDLTEQWAEKNEK